MIRTRFTLTPRRPYSLTLTAARFGRFEDGVDRVDEGRYRRLGFVEGRPLRRYNYARARFMIARADLAILEVQYFKRGAEEPYRVVTAPRGAMVEQDGHVLPTRLSVSNRARGTTTEVVLSHLRINPEIDDHAFSLQALESQRPLALQEH